jgi:hypothetical protein
MSRSGEPDLARVDRGSAVAEMMKGSEPHPRRRIRMPQRQSLMEAVSKAMSLSAPVTKMLVLLAKTGKLNLIPELDASYRERLLSHQNIVRADVTSAAQLSPEKTRALEDSLSKVTGKKVELSISVTPAAAGRWRIGSGLRGVKRSWRDAPGVGSMTSKRTRSQKLFASRSAASGRSGRGGSRHRGVDRRRHCAHAAASAPWRAKCSSSPRRVRHRAEPRRGQRRHGAARRLHGSGGRSVKRTGRIISVPVGEEMLGASSTPRPPIDGKARS